MARKKGAIEVLSPAESMAVNRTITQATQMAGLTPWQAAQIEWKTKKKRGQLIVQLAELEADAVLAEAMVMVEGRLEAAAEKSAAELFAARMNTLLDAGVMLDESLLAANQLSEDSQAIVSGAMYRVFGSFSRGVERRAGALS